MRFGSAICWYHDLVEIKSQSCKYLVQGIPAFRDFTIRDPRYFLILFQWKLAKKVDFRKIL